jgi:hypothetical protein
MFDHTGKDCNIAVYCIFRWNKDLLEVEENATNQTSRNQCQCVQFHALAHPKSSEIIVINV